MSSNELDATNKVLELNKISRQFGTDPAVHALVDVDLSLYSGDWMSITGPSGAGKSTLLHIIGCLDRPTSGSYFIDGVDTDSLTDEQRAGLRSQRIGFVFQSFHLLPYRNVLENVMLAEVYRKHPHRGRRTRALQAIERVGLGHRVDFLPAKLSGGERQRVAIARALVGSPSLLLCDEPTGNLDSKSSADLLDLFEPVGPPAACTSLMVPRPITRAQPGRLRRSSAMRPSPRQGVGTRHQALQSRRPFPGRESRSVIF
jgi:macrolide transport system ATP-binding/permease protein